MKGQCPDARVTPASPAPKFTVSACGWRYAAARINPGPAAPEPAASGRRQRMRIGIMAAETGGTRALDELADQLRRAADDGFASAWMSNIFGLEALTSLAVAGSQVPG